MTEVAAPIPKLGDEPDIHSKMEADRVEHLLNLLSN
jgi:hypothetical protein